MDVDTASDNTSIDDKIDDFCENPTRDALTEGLMSLLKPTVDQLDDRIRSTRICQIELKQQIESLTEELQKINEALQYPLETDSYVKKLINAKHKITIVSNILQTTQERLNKVHQAVEKSTAKKKTLLDNSSAYSSTVEPDKEESVKMEATLQTTQERLNKIHQAVEKSIVKRKTLLDNSSAYSSTVEPDKEESIKVEGDKQQ